MHYKVLPDGRWFFKFDNHTISTFTTCEELYNFKHIRNLAKKGGLGFNIAVGIWWSDVMSDLYEAIAKNQSEGKREPPPLVEVYASAAHHWFRHEMDNYKSLAPDKYKRFGGTQTFSVVRPGIEKTIELPLGAIEMVAGYYENRARQDARHWQIIATESAFGVLDDLIIGEDHKVVVGYQGRPDIVALDTQNRLMPLDHKTKDYPQPRSIIFDYKPHPQTAGYVYSLHALVESLGITDRVVDRCVLIVAGRYPPAEPRKKGEMKKPRFVEVQVHYTQAELREWRIQTVEKAHRLRDAIERGVFIKKESACHFQYGAPCEFRGICALPPGVREQRLKTDYIQINPWSAGAPEARNQDFKKLTKRSQEALIP